jgi:hypothetical protein
MRLILLLLFIVQSIAQQRWYYTGEFKNNVVADKTFEGIQYSSSDLHTPPRAALLNYGGILYRRVDLVNETAVDEVVEMLQVNVLGVANDTAIVVLSSITYELMMAKDYGAYPEYIESEEAQDPSSLEKIVFRAEVGLYDHQRKVFLEKNWRSLAVGTILAVEFQVLLKIQEDSALNHSDISTIDNSNVVNEMDVQVDGSILSPSGLSNTASTGTISAMQYDSRDVHKAIFTSDMMGRVSLYSHTWYRSRESSSTTNIGGTKPESFSDSRQDQDSTAAAVQQQTTPEGTRGDTPVDVTASEAKLLRVMSYNLWHNNPPSWVYHNPTYVDYCLYVCFRNLSLTKMFLFCILFYARERWARYQERLRLVS